MNDQCGNVYENKRGRVGVGNEKSGLFLWHRHSCLCFLFRFPSCTAGSGCATKFLTPRSGCVIKSITARSGVIGGWGLRDECLPVAGASPHHLLNSFCGRRKPTNLENRVFLTEQSANLYENKGLAFQRRA